MVGTNAVRGWRAISDYTDSTADELLDAIERGDLRASLTKGQVAAKAQALDAWLLARRLTLLVANLE